MAALRRERNSHPERRIFGGELPNIPGECLARGPFCKKKGALFRSCCIFPPFSQRENRNLNGSFTGEAPDVGFPSKIAHWAIFSPLPAFSDAEGFRPLRWATQRGFGLACRLGRCSMFATGKQHPFGNPTAFCKRRAKTLQSRGDNCKFSVTTTQTI